MFRLKRVGMCIEKYLHIQEQDLTCTTFQMVIISNYIFWNHLFAGKINEHRCWLSLNFCSLNFVCGNCYRITKGERLIHQRHRTSRSPVPLPRNGTDVPMHPMVMCPFCSFVTPVWWRDRETRKTEWRKFLWMPFRNRTANHSHACSMQTILNVYDRPILLPANRKWTILTTAQKTERNSE